MNKNSFMSMFYGMIINYWWTIRNYCWLKY